MDDGDSSDNANCINSFQLSGITCTHTGVGLCFFASFVPAGLDLGGLFFE